MYDSLILIQHPLSKVQVLLFIVVLLLSTVVTAFRTTTNNNSPDHTRTSITKYQNVPFIPRHHQLQLSLDRSIIMIENDEPFVIPSDLYEHRCYYQPCLQEKSRHPNNDDNHLLVICIGMAQTIQQYQSHVMYLAQYRDVLVYQADGLGLHYNYTTTTTTGNSNNTRNISLPHQARQLRHAIAYFYGNHGRSTESNPSSKTSISIINIDLIGFSLGGRIVLAFLVDTKTPKPNELDFSTNFIIQIHKVHLTGVSLHRSPYGIVQGMIWKDHLLVPNNDNNNNLRSFGWSILTAAYSPNFLYQNQLCLHQWIQSLCSSHTATGILHLIEQTHDHENDRTNPWSVENMIQQLALSLWNDDNHKKLQLRFLVGEYDVLALPEHVTDMVVTLRNQTSTTTVDNTVIVDDVVVVPNVGHAVPMEASPFWRKDMQSYLSFRN